MNRRILYVALGAVLLLTLALASFVRAQDQEDDGGQPFLGVTIAEADNGARVESVLPGSPAAEAGLEVGDIITAVSGDAVTAETLGETIRGYTSGASVDLTVERDGESLDLSATLAEAMQDENSFGFTMPLRERPFIGVSLEDGDDGVTIREVTADSPAAEAGLEVGDVITAINGEAVTSARDVVQAVRALEIGDSVTLDITRDGDVQTVEVTVGSAPDMMFGFGPRGREDRQGMPFGFGMRFGAMSFGAQVENQPDGAYVTEVAEDSPAAKAGLQTGDIVTAVNGEAVDEERTLFDRMVAYETDDVVTLEVQRGEENLELSLTVEAPQMGNFEDMMPFGFGPHGFQFDLPEGLPFGFDDRPEEDTLIPAQPNI